MNKLNLIGKVIIGIGILSLFKKVNRIYGFGGFDENSNEIIIVSIFLILTGISIVYLSKNQGLK